MKSRHSPAAVFPLLLLLYAGPAPAQPSRAKEICGLANRIALDLTQISGMKLRHPVPCDYITKEKINAFLNQRIKDVTSPEEIRAEELTLKKFGFVPQDFDLAQTTVDLLTEQAAATTSRSSLSPSRRPLTPRSRCWRTSWRTPWPTRISIWPDSSARDARAMTDPPRAWP